MIRYETQRTTFPFTDHCNLESMNLRSMNGEHRSNDNIKRPGYGPMLEEEFHPDQYVGLSVCSLYDYYFDGLRCKYYPALAVRVLSVNKNAGFAITSPDPPSIVVRFEAPDGKPLAITCKKKKTVRSYAYNKMFDPRTEYTWSISPTTKDYLMKLWHSSVNADDFAVELYENPLEVKKTIEAFNQALVKRNAEFEEKERIARNKAEYERINKQEADRIFAQENAKAAVQVDDLWRGSMGSGIGSNGSGSQGNAMVSKILSCPNCGQKLRLPSMNKTIVYTCKKCGFKASCNPERDL